MPDLDSILKNSKPVYNNSELTSWVGDSNNDKSISISDEVSNLEKNSKAWSNAFKHWVDFPKLQKGIFTNVIDWVLRALFTLVGVIILACCFYIVFIIACCNVAELKELLSQIGSIIISFGGWITASVLAIKQKR
jgi:hypothetical protein